MVEYSLLLLRSSSLACFNLNLRGDLNHLRSLSFGLHSLSSVHPFTTIWSFCPPTSAPSLHFTWLSLPPTLSPTLSPVGNYTDGSIESDLPMQQLSELFNVNHFIVSQVHRSDHLFVWYPAASTHISFSLSLLSSPTHYSSHFSITHTISLTHSSSHTHTIPLKVNAHSALLSSMALKATVWSSSLYGALVGFQRFLKAQCRDWLRNAVNLMTYRYVLLKYVLTWLPCTFILCSACTVNDKVSELATFS